MDSEVISTRSPTVAWPCCHSSRPQRDHTSDQRRGDHRMDQAQPFQIDQTGAARGHLEADRAGDTLLLAEHRAERAHHGHVADHIDQLTIDRGGL